jgi:hypothetical protein
MTIDSTSFIYTGGEEKGFVIGLINYPKFPQTKNEVWVQAVDLALRILDATFQWSTLVMDTDKTLWITKREG